MIYLITGVCGNIGSYIATQLLELGMDVIGIDIKTKLNLPTAKKLMHFADKKQRKFIMHWDDLTSPHQLQPIFEQNQLSGIIHLAFILPPFSEMNPERTHHMHIEGTKNLITLSKHYQIDVPFIFSSSTTVFGPQKEALIDVTCPAKATSQYTADKLFCEEMLRISDLNWRILRFSAVMNANFRPEKETIKYGLNIDLKTRIEPVHVKDVTTAVYHALTRKAAEHKILIIAGGEKNQTYYQEYILKMLSGFLGDLELDEIPWDKFGHKEYYLHWYNTEESERILNFQTHTLYDYVQELREKIRWQEKILISLVGKKIALKKYFDV